MDPADESGTTRSISVTPSKSHGAAAGENGPPSVWGLKGQEPPSAHQHAPSRAEEAGGASDGAANDRYGSESAALAEGKVAGAAAASPNESKPAGTPKLTRKKSILQEMADTDQEGKEDDGEPKRSKSSRFGSSIRKKVSPGERAGSGRCEPDPTQPPNLPTSHRLPPTAHHPSPTARLPQSHLRSIIYGSNLCGRPTRWT